MVIATVVALILGGCTSKARDAEEQYNIVSKSGTLAEKCDKARQVRDAYLADHDEQNYRLWASSADLACNAAVEEGGNLPADDATRNKVVDQALNVEADAAAAAASEALNEANEVAARH